MCYFRSSGKVILTCCKWQYDECPDPEGPKNLKKLNKFSQLDFAPFDPRTQRSEAKLRAPDGSTSRISKVGWFFPGPTEKLAGAEFPSAAVGQGAPHVLLSMCHNKDEIKPRVDAKVARPRTRPDAVGTAVTPSVGRCTSSARAGSDPWPLPAKIMRTAGGGSWVC